jgi:AraC family transcriptional regulator
LTTPFQIIRKRYAAGSRLPRHAHDQSSLIVTVRGRFTERAARQRRTITPGTVMLRAAGEIHADDFAEQTVCLAVPLSSSFFAANIDQPAPPPVTIVKAGPRVAALCARLARESASADPMSDITARGIMLELLAEILRGDETTHRRVAQGVALMRERIVIAFAEPLRIAALAASVGLAPARLSRMFKRQYGCTPTEMLRDERVAQAAALIRQRRFCLKDIAGRCGFYDQSHFSNIFRRVMGMTPRQYAQLTR